MNKMDAAIAKSTLSLSSKNSLLIGEEAKQEPMTLNKSQTKHRQKSSLMLSSASTYDNLIDLKETNSMFVSNNDINDTETTSTTLTLRKSHTLVNQTFGDIMLSANSQQKQPYMKFRNKAFNSSSIASVCFNQQSNGK